MFNYESYLLVILALLMAVVVVCGSVALAGLFGVLCHKYAE